jgi:hypothetical protein
VISSTPACVGPNLRRSSQPARPKRNLFIVHSPDILMAFHSAQDTDVINGVLFLRIC